MKLWGILFLLCFMGACAPVSRGLTTASDTASGISRVGYAAEPWDVINSLVEIVPNYTPLGTHGSLQVVYLEDNALGLSATPVGGVIAYDRKVEPFTIDITVIDQGDFSEVRFDVNPADYEAALSVKDNLIVQLDAKLRRRSLS